MVAGFVCWLTGTVVSWEGLSKAPATSDAATAFNVLVFAPVLGRGVAVAGFVGALVTGTFLDHRRVVGAAVAGTISFAVVVSIHLAILF